jgi:hypothetical protein
MQTLIDSPQLVYSTDVLRVVTVQFAWLANRPFVVVVAVAATSLEYHQQQQHQHGHYHFR